MALRRTTAMAVAVVGCCWALGLAAQEASKPAAKEAPKAAEPAKKAEKETVEVREDRIKAVQRKEFLKKMRWELTPWFNFSLNDAFYQKMGGGAAVSFHPADALGLEVQALYFGTIQSDMVGYFQQANQALPKVSNLQYTIVADLLWSPLYGKLAFFTDDIVHFDAYLIAGLGTAKTETGFKLASNFGIGLRYFLTSWLVVKLELRDLMYTETFKLDVRRDEYSDIQNHVFLGVGVSFFLPTEIEYEFQ